MKKKKAEIQPENNDMGIVAGGVQFSDELEISIVYDKYTRDVTVTLTDSLHKKKLIGVTKLEEVKVS